MALASTTGLRTEEEITKMGGDGVGQILDTLPADTLRSMLIYISGYSPEALAAALNWVEEGKGR